MCSLKSRLISITEPFSFFRDSVHKYMIHPKFEDLKFAVDAVHNEVILRASALQWLKNHANIHTVFQSVVS